MSKIACSSKVLKKSKQIQESCCLLLPPDQSGEGNHWEYAYMRHLDFLCRFRTGSPREYGVASVPKPTLPIQT